VAALPLGGALHGAARAALADHQRHWETGDLLALTEQVERYRTPYGSTVKLVNRMTGEERHVAVLSVGRMEPLEIPEKHEPWLHFHERLPWPMELSSGSTSSAPAARSRTSSTGSG
jgi:hypothetical protein